MKLCDTCANMRHRLTPTACACIALGEIPMRRMPDEGETPVQICGPYEPRSEHDDDE